MTRHDPYTTFEVTKVTRVELEYASSAVRNWLSRCTSETEITRDRHGPYVTVKIGGSRIAFRSEDDEDPPPAPGQVVVVVATRPHTGPGPSIDATTHSVTAIRNGERRTAPLHDWVFDPGVVFTTYGRGASSPEADPSGAADPPE